ncbi:esterase/lipase family protein [Pseudomonas sp. NPDC090233]|uniref:esterase/lipase family protein n=1 Tax=Pseudomonas sp. NPDC090233 TaxID=3364479 RepID=UPI00383B9FD0
MIDPLKLLTVINPDGTRTASSTMSSSTQQQEKEIGVKENKVVPIVFIPGIMGTNLWNNRTKKIAWVAPNTDTILSKFSAIGSFVSALLSSAKDRQNDLDGRKGMITVYQDGPIRSDGLTDKLNKDELQRRGWGGIMRSAYHPIMISIQNEMNTIMVDRALQGWWKDHCDMLPGDWGDWNSNSPLSELADSEGLKHAAEISYEVWAGGYNWLQSNKDSAKDIIDLINHKILPSYPTAKNVIIVTHSMGGLVARAMIGAHGYQKIDGIVHGAMPATGAPAAYRRIRAGFEGDGLEGFVTRQILGPTAKETVAVLAYSRGGLELLPAANYNDGKKWLFARKKQSELDKDRPPIGKDFITLPEAGDPYEEIYKSQKWWGLIPKESEKLIDPNEFQTDEEEVTFGTPQSKRAIFEENINKTKAFHTSIQDAYHSPTYVHYSAEAESEKLITWGEITWESDWIGWEDLETLSITSDDYTGRIELGAGRIFSFAPKESPGDGTVPVISSASSRASPNVKGAFAHGINTLKHPHACKAGLYNKTAGYEHQNAYNDPDGRTLYATLYSIVRISSHVKI